MSSYFQTHGIYHLQKMWLRSVFSITPARSKLVSWYFTGE